MFQLDPLSRVPVYEQIKEQLERFILNGTIRSGEQIPSVRSLSLTLSINPNTILKAYSELDRRGLICSVPGKGYFVCEDAMAQLNQDMTASLHQLLDKISEMALAGVRREDVLRCVDDAYKRAEKILAEQRGQFT